MPEPEIEGRLGMCIDLRVTMQEMSRWTDRRIALFFDGLSKAIEAAADDGGGNLTGHVEVKVEKVPDTE